MELSKAVSVVAVLLAVLLATGYGYGEPAGDQPPVEQAVSK